MPLNELTADAGKGAVVGAIASLISKDRSLKKTLLSALAGGTAGAGLSAIGSSMGDDKAAPAVATAPKENKVSPAIAAIAGAAPVIGPAAHTAMAGGSLKDVAISGGASWAGGLAGMLGGKGLAATGKLGKGHGAALLPMLITLAGSGAGAALGANHINKEASVQDLIPDRGALGVMSDLANSPSSRRVSGRATALAEALEEDAGATVARPSSTRFATRLLASLLGGATGLATGEAMGRKEVGQKIHDGLLGAGLGGLTGSVVNAVQRRKEIARIKALAEERLAQGAQLQPIYDDTSPAAGVANGAHQLGRADVAEAVAFGRKKFAPDSTSDVIETASSVPLLGKLLLPLTAINSMADQAEARRRLRDAMPRPNTAWQ